MNIIINKDYEAMSEKAADFIAKYIAKKPDTLLCIAGGETPMGIFRYLVKYADEKKIDFSKLLENNNILDYVLENNNHHDKYAVALYKQNIKLGYVKLINSKVFYYSKYKPTISVHSIEKNGILKRVFIKIIFK